MNFRTLVLRSLQHRFRSHIGVVLGAAVGAAALVGALVVGDSVRESLRTMASARLGRVDAALNGGDRFFRSQLAQEISADARNNTLDSEKPATAAALLQLPGIASASDASARANHVQVLGVDAAFWKLAPKPPAFDSLAADSVVLSAALAQQLSASQGEVIVIRVQKPGALSRDAVVSPQNDLSVALRLKVFAVVTDEQFGRFGLQASQIAPLNAFVNLDRLAEAVGQTNRANLLLFSNGGDSLGMGEIMADPLLEQHWQLADAGLELRTMAELSGTELRSSRIFLEPSVVVAAKKEVANAVGVATYMVNELELGSLKTPYSMVAAATEPYVPSTMREDQILINQWLAEDLQAHAGDKITLKYFVMGTGRALEEKQADFSVFGIVPLGGYYADRSLMPDFPGIAEAESSSDWDAGFTIDMKRIRPKDEQYWKQHRGTPKAFIALKKGEELWANRFGSLTALRFPPSAGTVETLSARLRLQITPKSLGLVFEPVRQQAADASAQAQDFGGLFIGFSFFLIVAALILMGLLFQFSVEQRSTEIGTLLGVGFRPAQVRRLLLVEGILLSAIGSVAGMAGGMVYARAMLAGLMTLWRDAVGTSSLKFHAAPESLILGALCSLLMAVIPVWLTLRRQAQQPIRELLTGNALSKLSASSRRRFIVEVSVALAAAAGAAGLLLHSRISQEQNPAETFFYAAGLLLICGLALASLWLKTAGNSRSSGLFGLALRGCGRRRNRSLATVSLLACGIFLIVSIGAFRVDARLDSTKRSAGTGGFALIGESAFPVTHDLNTTEGREFHGLGGAWTNGFGCVPFRVHAGDEASCLNLNHAQKPRLLGVNPALLAQRGAFTFAEVLSNSIAISSNAWEMLNATPTTDTAVPAIADENSILWAMGKKLGDTVDYSDAYGRKFQVRLVGALANSVLQGNIIISEKEFLRHFPDESGYRMFLLDAAAGQAAEVSASLARAMQTVGLELTPCAQRLDQYNAVQNTYLNTFQVLGGLGLLLGSAGLGVVVLRNVLERRGELALLLAVGFRRSQVQRLLLLEHAALLLVGLLVGTGVALVAVLPMLVRSPAQFPLASLSLTLVGVALNGLFCARLAAGFALRGNLTDALRSE